MAPEDYGWAASAIRDDPELAALFAEAVDSGVWDEVAQAWSTPPWTAAKFVERVRQTDWYRREGHNFDLGIET